MSPIVKWDTIGERRFETGVDRGVLYPTSGMGVPWNGLTEDIKSDKIIQVLAYAYMYENEAKGKPIEAGIISFKNLKSGFLPFVFKEEKELNSIINESVLSNYIQQIVLLLGEILDENIPFEEKI